MFRLMAVLILFYFTQMEKGIFATPAKRSSLLLDDSSIHTETVGLNNRQEVLAKFNLTEAMMSRIYAGINAASKEAEADGRTMQYFNNIREFRVNDIKNRISNAIHNVHSEENPEHPLHEMAAYPTCNAETTETSWLQDNNITMQFSQAILEKGKDLNLDSAILRLYKVNPNDTQSGEPTKDEPKKTDDTKDDDESDADETAAGGKLKRCVQPNMDAQIRVTVSLVQQLRGRNKRGVYERRKRICNTVMMNVTQTGWVEIDIKRAIYIWEEKLQQTQQTRPNVLVGWLMIEVHDEEEQPLKPGLFFKPPNCNQADIAIPWNYYRPDPSMPSFTTYDVPKYPRLDVKMIGYASFAPINLQHNEQGDKLYANLKLRVFNMTPEIHDDTESTTNIAPTADNHLDSNDDMALIRVKKEMQQQQQREHKQHKRHLKLEQLKEQLEVEEAKEEKEMKEYQQQQQQQQHKHKHHRHHHRQQHDDDDDDVDDNNKQHNQQQHVQHHHSRYYVEKGEQNVDIEQQQHEAKILQHIAHKLQQEEKQLHLLQQQQQQQQSVDTFNM